MLYENQEAFSKELDMKLQNHSETLKKAPTQAVIPSKKSSFKSLIQSKPTSYVQTPVSSIIVEEPEKKIEPEKK